MSGAPARAVLYARLSKDATGEGAGVGRQLEDARRLAEMRDLAIVAEYTDNDMSAAGTKKRPGFEAAVQDLEAGRANVLVAWAWDRLSRNRRDTLRLIEVGQEHRVTVALVRGSDIDMASAAGRLVADLLASVARAEVDQKGERQRRAELQRAEAGKPPSRRAFGYRTDGSIEPVEGPAAAEVFSLYLAGSTLIGIARHLTENGHLTTRGKKWGDSSVRVMLTNPRYMGERRYLGERIAVGTWAPLVTPETFEAVQARLRDSSRTRARPARRHLGSSLYKCHCGANVRVNYAHSGKRIYTCQSRPHMSRMADDIDDLVRRVIAERLRRHDLRSIKLSDASGPDLAALRQRAVGYRERRDRLAQDYADDLLTARQVAVATKRINDQLTDVEQQLADAGKTSALASIAGAPDLGDAWLALPLDRQRAVLQTVAEVVILPAKLGRPRAFDPTSVDIRPKA